MPEHQEQFDLYLTMPEAMLVCREAIAELNWMVIEEYATGLLCKEPQEVISFNWAATAEISLNEGSRKGATRVTISARNFAWGRIQKNHLAGQVGNLRNKMAVSASRMAKSGKAQGDGDLSAELERLADLHGRGILTDEEFATAKARLLDR